MALLNGTDRVHGNFRGRDTECKRCEFCHTKQYGCLDAVCYCHTHELMPPERNTDEQLTD